MALVETLFAQFHGPANGRRLLAVAEPIVPTADGMRVAATAIEALGDAFQTAEGTLPTVLRASCEAAHDQVRAANQPAGPRSLDDRVYVGLTAVAVDGEEMLIAQAPPGQAIVVQDQQLYAVPSLDSWRCDYDAAEHDGAARPLGAGHRPALRISATTASPTDRVVLCSSGLAACLGRGLAEADAQPDALAPAFTGNQEDLAADLEELAQALGAGRCLAACVHSLENNEHWIWTADRLDVTSAVRPWPRRRHVVASNNKPNTLAAPAADGAQSTAQPREEVSGNTAVANAPDPAPDVPCENASDPDRPRGFGRSFEAMDRIQNACVTAFERVLGGIGSRLRRGNRGAYTFPAPGARTMRLYRSSLTGPIAPSIRAHLPRGPRVHVPVRLLSVLVSAVLIFAIAGFFYDRDRDRDARAQAYLARADAQLRTVAAANDPAAVTNALGAAQSALDDARDNGAEQQLVATRQSAVDTARDAVRGIDRLERATRLGTLPPVADAAVRRLIMNGRDVYLLSGGLYHLDAQSHSLTLLLEPGMRIDRATVKDLRDVTVDGGVLTATDGLALYRLRPDGSWDRERIGRVDEKTPWDITASAAFEGSFYVLDGENGQILKFPAEQLTSLPDDWAGAEERDEIAGALDMVIDGRIYVLLEDGTIQTYYRGNADGAVSVEIEPGISRPVALFGGPSNAYLYVADGGIDGRITRFDRAGGEIRQYLLPRNTPAGAAAAFAVMDDFVVDEAAGIVYVLSGNQLWTATIPMPGAVAQAN